MTKAKVDPKRGVQLPAELWAIIFPMVKRPIPAPGGKAERSSIRQPDLAALMRCSKVSKSIGITNLSKLFNNIAAPLLYNAVITDHLPSLVYNIKRRAAAKGIMSKAELVKLIERLFVEYYDKVISNELHEDA